MNKREQIEVYKADIGDSFTVGELIELLRNADPDAEIVVGEDENHPDSLINHVIVEKHLVGLFFNREPAPDEYSEKED